VTEWLRFFFWGWGVHLTAYTVLQVGALLTLRGRLRLWALVPVPITALVVGRTFQAWLAGSPTWPMTLIVASPLLAFVVGVLWFRGVNVQHHPRAKQLRYLAVALLVGSFLVGVVHSFV